MSQERDLNAVQVEYTRLMAQAGDLYFKAREIEAQLTKIRTDLANIEARRINLGKEAAQLQAPATSIQEVESV